MAFKLVSDPMDTQVIAVPISSLAVTLGEVLEWDLAAVAWTAGDASTMAYQRKVVATETVASGATEVKGIVVHSGQLWAVDGVNAADATHNGDRMLLHTDGLQVNNTGTDNTTNEACFVQTGINTFGGQDLLLGYFTGNLDGSNPLAT